MLTLPFQRINYYSKGFQENWPLVLRNDTILSSFFWHDHFCNIMLLFFFSPFWKKMWWCACAMCIIILWKNILQGYFNYSYRTSTVDGHFSKKKVIYKSIRLYGSLISKFYCVYLESSYRGELNTEIQTQLKFQLHLFYLTEVARN